jgi:translation initiation factor IF-2
MKVQQLAKELGKSTKELIKLLRELDIKVKSGSTRFDDDTIAQIKDLFKGDRPETPEEKKASDRFIMTDAIITVANLAKLLEVNLSEVMRVFLQKGLMVNLNSEVDYQVAQEVAQELEVDLKKEDISAEKENVIRDSLETIAAEEADKYSDDLTDRPPVITIMGHVDHGKTLLLDTIRNASVADHEAGGITQHIGAYQVDVNDKKLTFLDTPGHAAFTTLRARGAQVTDIAILVVAAEEGIKPQTIEAIHHAKAAGVPIIVALNKIDKPEANVERCKQQLSEHELVAEDWGGKTIIVNISAKTGEGIKDLLEMIVLVSDMLELKASVACDAKAVIIESRLSRQKGPMATILVKSGTLKIGDNFVIGTTAGKVKALFDDKGNTIIDAGPGTPVEILGISEVPQPGCILEVIENERAVRSLVQERKIDDRSLTTNSTTPVSLEVLANQIEIGDIQKLNLIIKADVIGSVEAILNFVNQISNEDITINIMHTATGTVNENDVMLAKASSAIIIAFSVEVNSAASRLAEDESVEIRTYSIIYEILEDIKKVMDGMYRPVFEEVKIAEAEVRQLYKYSRVGIIAGCYILSGKAIRNAIAKIYRGKDGKEILFTGKINSLKRFKEDVKEVKDGFECGIVVEGYNQYEVGDIVKIFEVKEKNRG